MTQEHWSDTDHPCIRRSGRGAGAELGLHSATGPGQPGAQVSACLGRLAPSDRAFPGSVDGRPVGDRVHSGHDWQPGSRIASAGWVGRRNGQFKERMAPIEFWIKQQMIRIFVPLTRAKNQDWLLSYKVE